MKNLHINFFAATENRLKKNVIENWTWKLVVKILAVFTCEIWGSHSSVDEDPCLSGMYAMSQGNNLCFFG